MDPVAPVVPSSLGQFRAQRVELTGKSFNCRAEEAYARPGPAGGKPGPRMEFFDEEDSYGQLMGRPEEPSANSEESARSPGGTAKPRFEQRVLVKVIS
jgi:hypothetical protein